MNRENLKRDNAQYLWHPMAHPRAMREQRPDIIARGEGCWVWDVDGHKLLDGATVGWPVRSICSRVMISTGATVSMSTRLMLEPVTSIFSTFWVCWAAAPVAITDSATPVPSACTSAP